MKLDDDIHNYYEHLVLERINKLGLDGSKSPDYLADLCCLALNQVPPRYIRYEVDMAFYMSPDELGSTRDSIERTVAEAILFVAEHSRKD